MLLFSHSYNEAEERYRKRESRTEDLELIATLQHTIASYQEQLKKIHVSCERVLCDWKYLTGSEVCSG
jgi:hypothetical protein